MSKDQPQKPYESPETQIKIPSVQQAATEPFQITIHPSPTTPPIVLESNAPVTIKSENLPYQKSIPVHEQIPVQQTVLVHEVSHGKVPLAPPVCETVLAPVGPQVVSDVGPTHETIVIHEKPSLATQAELKAAEEVGKLKEREHQVHVSAELAKEKVKEKAAEAKAAVHEKEIEIKEHVHEHEAEKAPTAKVDLKEYAMKIWQNRLGERWKTSVVNHYHGPGWALAMEKEEIKLANVVTPAKHTVIHAFAQRESGEILERSFDNIASGWEVNAAVLSPQVNQWVTDISGNNPKLS